MQSHFKKLPRDIQGLIRRASSVSLSMGMPAYLVGGFVRDLLRGEPNCDVDIVVEGDAIRFAEGFASQLNAGLVRHRRFGTATVIAGLGHKVDFATARQETYPHPGSLPVVKPGSLEDDAARRDFTINTMAIRLRRDSLGGLVDYFNGRRDLALKKIRVLHRGSFNDDPTRILRAIRFEQRLGFRIEGQSLKFLRQAVQQAMLCKVSPQRIRDELILLLKEKNPLPPLRRARQLTGFSFIHPRLSVTARTLRLLASGEEQIRMYEENGTCNRTLDTWVMYLMALLDPLSPRDVRAVCARFVFAKGDEKRILDYALRVRALAQALHRRGLEPSAVYALLEPHSYEVILMAKAKDRVRATQKRIVDFLYTYSGMRISIKGQDLKGLGLAPGPAYQKILAKVLSAKLDGRLTSREEELALARTLIHGR